MEIIVTGISYRTAPVEVREQVALPEDQSAQLLRAVQRERICEEGLVLNTCNRMEFYGVANGVPWSVPHLLRHVAQVKRTGALPEEGSFYSLKGMDAVRHIFRVAASLDSQVVGEHEILGQIKTAFRQAHEARTARFMLNKLMHRAFHVGKRVFTETKLGQGAASVAGAAVEMARGKLGGLEGRTVLLVGAGETAELAARAVIGEGATQLIVANRTLAKAQSLAQTLESQALHDPLSMDDTGFEGCREMSQCPAVPKPPAECSLLPKAAKDESPLSVKAITLAEIPDLIGQADLVIASTGAPEPILTSKVLAPRLEDCGHPVMIVDIGVPRNADSALQEIPGVLLYNVDGLQAIVAANVERRQHEIPRAEAIVEHEVKQFENWMHSLGAVPTIKGLQERVTRLQQAEMERYCSNLPAAERDRLEAFARGLCSKILHEPITFLRESSRRAPGAGDLAAIEVVRQMFRLDDGQEGSD